mgnify:CR=1 FL=1
MIKTATINMTESEFTAIASDPRWDLSGPGACDAIRSLAVEVLGSERAAKALFQSGYLINTGWRPSSAYVQALIMAARASGIKA